MSNLSQTLNGKENDMERSNIENMFAEDPQQMPLNKQEAPVVENDETPEADENIQPKKNHQDRRWDKLFNRLEETQERLSEAEQFKQDVLAGKFNSSQSNIPDHFKKMYEDGLTIEERWAAQKDYEARREVELVERAKENILREQRAEREQQEKWEDFIDMKLEALEESHGVDFTSGSTQAERRKKNFLSTLKELSEDENGNIEQYASFEKTFELWNKTQKQPESNVQQKKDISSFGGQRSVPVQQDVEAGTGGWFGWRNQK